MEELRPVASRSDLINTVASARWIGTLNYRWNRFERFLLVVIDETVRNGSRTEGEF